MNRGTVVLALAFCSAWLAAGPSCSPADAQGPLPESAPVPPFDAVAAESRGEIARAMKAEAIPGLAVALLDREGVQWTEGFGFTDDDRKIAITPDTLFSVQSMSKTVTATAVMLAVRDGLVQLDTPIKAYLPGFTVRSRFEPRPEEKMTLRHLLSHTAGLAHEAPFGSNADADASSFERHIQSISETWLRFPVGRGYSYSNLGIDLAGYVLQVRSGMPFADYVRTRLLEPLGMRDSTFDMTRVRAATSRAIGHEALCTPKVPLEVPMIPAGGFYTTARDLAKFVQFHLNRGRVDGTPLIDAALLAPMYEAACAGPCRSDGYGLGVDRAARHGTYRLSHGGGGFGFLTYMAWYPELGLGVVALTNLGDHSQQAALPGRILDRAIEKRFGTERCALGEGCRKPLSDWSRYVGTYRVRYLGFHGLTVFVSSAGACLNVKMLPPGRVTCVEEYQPGVFSSAEGDVLSFEGGRASWQNMAIEKFDVPQLAYGLAGATWAACLGFCLAWIGRAVALRRARAASRDEAGVRSSWLARGPLALGFLASLLAASFLTLLVSVMPALIGHGLAWSTHLPVEIRVVLLLPAIVLGAAVLLVGWLVVAWRRKRWSLPARVLVALGSLVLLADAAALAGWRLFRLPW
jgi:CubicO group peptidase (beta-lactamase class C family)